MAERRISRGSYPYFRPSASPVFSSHYRFLSKFYIFFHLPLCAIPIKFAILCLSQIPVYTLPQSKSTSDVPPAIRNRVSTARPDKWLPSRVQQRQACQSDRFIPQRRHRDFAASNYILTRVPPRSENLNQLDLFGQILSLKSTWRKKLMKSALEKANLLPNTGHQRVLNIGKAANRENYKDTEENIYASSTDGVWKTKPRNKPLIGSADASANVPTMRHNWARGLLDWGATNLIATMSARSIVIFDGSKKIATSSPGRSLVDITAKARQIKWNHAGTKIAVCTSASQIMIYDLESQKFRWCRNCHCTIDGEFECEIQCVDWISDDSVIVTGCTEGRLTSYTASSGTMIDTFFGHADSIITMAFSPNDRYLVTAGMDSSVHVHTWPSLTPHLAIGYYEPVQALAFHPWEPDMLCVGGGFDDGSLTLWNIHRQSSLGYRKVPLISVVKSMAWNKLSGELVVQWNYQYNEDTIHTIVPVFANLDQVVDVVATSNLVMDIVWNPSGTQLAMRAKKSVKFWNFFGNESSNWYDEKRNCDSSKEKRQMSAGRTGFGKYTIR